MRKCGCQAQWQPAFEWMAFIGVLHTKCNDGNDSLRLLLLLLLANNKQSFYTHNHSEICATCKNLTPCYLMLIHFIIVNKLLNSMWWAVPLFFLLFFCSLINKLVQPVACIHHITNEKKLVVYWIILPYTFARLCAAIHFI